MPSFLSLIAAFTIPAVAPAESAPIQATPRPIVILAAPNQLANKKLGSYSISTLTAEQARSFAKENDWRYEESAGRGFLIDSFGSGLHQSRLKLLANQAMMEGNTELETDRIGELGTLVKLFLAGTSNLSSDSVKASNIKFIIVPSDQVRLVAADGTTTAALVHKNPTEPEAMPQTTELAFVAQQIGDGAKKRGRIIYPGNLKLAAAFSHVSGENAQNQLREEGLRNVSEILDANAKEVEALKKRHFSGLSSDWQMILARAEEKASLSSLSTVQRDLLLSRVVQKEKIPALQAGGSFEGVSPVLMIRVFLKPFGEQEQHISVIL